MDKFLGHPLVHFRAFPLGYWERPLLLVLVIKQTALLALALGHSLDACLYLDCFYNRHSRRNGLRGGSVYLSLEVRGVGLYPCYDGHKNDILLRGNSVLRGYGVAVWWRNFGRSARCRNER